MSKIYTTPVVDQISAANIYIDPSVWSKIIVHVKGGKPNWLAIHLFSRILYWYTRSAVYDENTGRFLGYKKKFKYDKCQMSYRHIMEQMGCTYKEAREALASLVHAKLVTNEKRHVNGFGNLMFIEPIPANILCIINPKGVHKRTPSVPAGADPSVPAGAESTLCSYTLNSSKAIIGAHPVDNSGQLPTSARPPTDNFDKKQKAREQIAKLTEILTKRK